jgi:hypothetical protein
MSERLYFAVYDDGHDTDWGGYTTFEEAADHARDWARRLVGAEVTVVEVDVPVGPDGEPPDDWWLPDATPKRTVWFARRHIYPAGEMTGELRPPYQNRELIWGRAEKTSRPQPANDILSHPEMVALTLTQHREMSALVAEHATERLQLSLAIRRELNRTD